MSPCAAMVSAPVPVSLESITNWLALSRPALLMASPPVVRMFPPVIVLPPFWAKVIEVGSTVPGTVTVQPPVPSVPAEKTAALPSAQNCVAERPVESVVQLAVAPTSHVPPALPESVVGPVVSQYSVWAKAETETNVMNARLRMV
ncbi:MAG: hypothetical protein U1F77_16790 [Kiritimatiellia bacterium]